MNFSFLPSKIKEQIETLVKDKTPISMARSNTAIDGNPGESYVVAFQDKMLFFSRKLGEHDYLQMSGDFGRNVSGVKLRKDGNNSFLDATINGQPYSLKFSSFEEKNLLPIVENSRSSGAAPKADGSASPAQTSVVPAVEASSAPVKGKFSSLLEGLAAAMMYLSATDDDIAKEEDAFIRIVCNNDQNILKSALQYYKSHSFDELLIALSGMDHEQKLCFLANLMELGMTDGVLHRSEMKLIKEFCSYMDLTEDEYETIKQVLLIKNKLSVLD